MALRITTWNVNGIRNPFSYYPWSQNKSYRSMFDTLGADIICFQELKLQRKDLEDSMVFVPGFTSFFTFPRYKKGYSGVAVYCRNSKVNPIRAEEGITGHLDSAVNPGTAWRDLPETQNIGGYPDIGKDDALALDSEGRALVVDFGGFVLIGTYCPAATDPARDAFRESFVRTMFERVRNLITMGREVVIVGDLNIARAEIDSCEAAEWKRRHGTDDWLSTETRQQLDEMLNPAKGGMLVDVCREFWPERRGMYTCWDTFKNKRPGNAGSRIDYILASRTLLPWFSEANIQEGLMGSDHCPVYATLHPTVGSASDIHTVDLLNPPDTFLKGERTDLPMPSPPKLAMHLAPEFRGRQNLKLMFQKMSAKRPASPQKDSSLSKKSNPEFKKTIQNKPTGIVSRKRKNTHETALAPQKSLKTFFTPMNPSVGANSGDDSQRSQIGEDEITGALLAPTHSQAVGDPLRHKDVTHNNALTNNPAQLKQKWASLFTPPPKPRCSGHGEECVQYTVKKPGVNYGRGFWLCPRPIGPDGDGGKGKREGERSQWKCGYFKWANESQ